MLHRDDSARLLAAVADARSGGGSLTLQGSGTKARRYPVLRRKSGAMVSTSEHSGVLYYAPEELILEARSGTRLEDLAALLAEHRQQFVFEPPRYLGGGTLGGAVATGLAGPARPWTGAPRDAVLGVEMINGLGERVRFGGRVVKNVAGYDLARLQVGAFGTLGCLLSIALRVIPAPAQQLSLVASLEESAALAKLAHWHQAALPITASCWLDGELTVRLAGPAAAVEQAARCLEDEVAARQRQTCGYWSSLRDQTHPFFEPGHAGRTLYRASLPPGAPALQTLAPCLSEWRGAQRWFWLREDEVGLLRERCQQAGGWLAAAAEPMLAPTASAVVAKLQRRVREAFDPDGCFNPHLLAPQGSTGAY